MQTPEEYEITLRVNALVKGLKKRRGYTKKDISQKLGIGLTTFNDYLNGVSSFKLGTLIKFASLCKLTLPDILDDTLEAKKLYSEDLADRANTGKNTLDFLAFIIFIPTAISGFAIQWVFLLLLILLTLLARKDLNSQLLTAIFFGVSSLLYLVLTPLRHYMQPIYSGFIQNMTYFSLAILSDFLMIYLLRNKMSLSVKLTKGNNKSVFEKNYMEGPIGIVIMGLLFVDSLAFLENIIRNLEHFGINEDFARQFWEVQFIFDNFKSIKFFLMAVIIILLFVGTRIRHRQSSLATVELIS